MASRLRKTRKLRGSRFHGWGQVGQHRKSGGKGGRGNAGLLKHKWTHTVKFDPDHFGKPKYSTPGSFGGGSWINVGDLDSLADRQGNLEGKSKRAGPQELDLAALGYKKLLGRGVVSKEYRIKISDFSASAKEKISHAGGELLG